MSEPERSSSESQSRVVLKHEEIHYAGPASISCESSHDCCSTPVQFHDLLPHSQHHLGASEYE